MNCVINKLSFYSNLLLNITKTLKININKIQLIINVNYKYIIKHKIFNYCLLLKQLIKKLNILGIRVGFHLKFKSLYR